MGFIWDNGNLPKLPKHKVEREEAEQALADPDRISEETYRDTRTGEPRTAATGETEDGRLLVVVFTQRGPDYRVIMARPADSDERLEYEKRRQP